MNHYRTTFLVVCAVLLSNAHSLAKEPQKKPCTIKLVTTKNPSAQIKELRKLGCLVVSSGINLIASAPELEHKIIQIGENLAADLVISAVDTTRKYSPRLSFIRLGFLRENEYNKDNLSIDDVVESEETKDFNLWTDDDFRLLKPGLTRAELHAIIKAKNTKLELRLRRLLKSHEKDLTRVIDPKNGLTFRWPVLIPDREPDFTWKSQKFTRGKLSKENRKRLEDSLRPFIDQQSEVFCEPKTLSCAFVFPAGNEIKLELTSHKSDLYIKKVSMPAPE